MNDLSLAHAVLLATAAILLSLAPLSAAHAQVDPLSKLDEISSTSSGDPTKDGAADSDGGDGSQGGDTPDSAKTNLEKPSDVAETVWEYPLFRSGTNERGEPTYVHLNDLLIAIATFALVFFLLRWLVRLGLRQLFSVLKVRGSTEHIAQKAASMSLIVVGAILAMVLGGLPWGVMALTLGLLAIGMTLGAQKLLGNYLSGFVMAAERIVEPGDCVEVDGQLGYVQSIRGRYTRVRRFDGVDVLMPNSRLLESSFTNWHGNSKEVRDKISVSVVYGASAETVIEVLEDQCSGVDAILDDPKPVVLLAKFGDSGVRFDVYFWTEADDPTQLWVVASDLRRAIYTAFDDAGIVFAFPQRQLHLDRDVAELVGDEAPAGEEPRATKRRGKNDSDDPEAADALSGRDAATEDAEGTAETGSGEDDA